MKPRLLVWLAWSTLLALGYPVRADDPLLLGRVEIADLATGLPQLAKLLQQVNPDSAELLETGLAAISFNPELKSFDLSKPIVLFLYSCPQELGGNMEWCLSFAKKGPAAVPPQLQSKDGPIQVKEAGDRCYVARLPGLPELTVLADLSGKATSGASDLTITWWPATGLERNQQSLQSWRGELARSLFRQADGASPATLRKAQSDQVRLDLAEWLLGQVREITVAIRLGKEELELNLTALPVPGSWLGQLSEAQGEGEDPVAVALPNLPGWAGAVHLHPTAALRQGMMDGLRRLAMELADGIDPEYCAVLTSVIAEWTGQGWFCEVTPDGNDASCLVHHLALATSRNRWILADSDSAAPRGGVQSRRLTQHQAVPELRLMLFEKEEGIDLIQRAASSRQAKEVRTTVSTALTTEVRLGPGEIQLALQPEPKANGQEPSCFTCRLKLAPAAITGRVLISLPESADFLKKQFVKPPGPPSLPEP